MVRVVRMTAWHVVVPAPLHATPAWLGLHSLHCCPSSSWGLSTVIVVLLFTAAAVALLWVWVCISVRAAFLLPRSGPHRLPLGVRVCVCVWLLCGWVPFIINHRQLNQPREAML